MEPPAAGGRAGVFAGLLQLRQDLLARLVRAAVVEIARRAFDLGGDVLHLREDIRDLLPATQLALAAAREIPVLEQIGVLRRILIKTGRRTVMIGEDQPAGRDERGRAVGQAHGRSAGAVEPGLGDVGAVFLLDQACREVVIGPHAFIGAGRCGGQQGQQGDESSATDSATHEIPFEGH